MREYAFDNHWDYPQIIISENVITLIDLKLSVLENDQIKNETIPVCDNHPHTLKTSRSQKLAKLYILKMGSNK